MTTYEAIFCRKSVRKFKKDEVDPWILNDVERFGEYAMGIRPEIKVKWKIVKASDHALKGLFMVKAPYYVLLYSEVCEDYLRNAGCLMEQLSLELYVNGIGSCYQGAAKPKAETEDDLEFIMAMAFGYPAESMVRSEDHFKRRNLKKMMTLHGNFGKIQRRLLEAARLAPSSMNLQPWRFVVSDSRVHLFAKKPDHISGRNGCNMNLFDAGIALSHMLITSEEMWFDVEYQKLDSILEKDFQNYVYVCSLLILDESEKI